MQTGEDVVAHLVARLREIPEGSVAKTARDSGVESRHLRKLRAGVSADIRITTLQRLARGMQTTMADLLGEADAPPQRPREVLSEERLRAVERLARETEKLAHAARDLVVAVQERARER